MAASAVAITSSVVRVSSPPNGATPIDTETPQDATSSVAMRAMSASASAIASWPSALGRSTANSSPARRARTSVERNLPAHRLGDAPKRDVPRTVAARVVDRLQAIHVDQEQRADPAVAAAERELGVELLAKAPAVHEPGERVVVGDVAELLLEALALGDVLDLDDAVGSEHRRRSGIVETLSSSQTSRSSGRSARFSTVKRSISPASSRSR